MVMVNKAVLNSIAAPCFLLFCQLVIAVLMLQASAVLGEQSSDFPPRERSTKVPLFLISRDTKGYFTLPKIDLEICKAIWPLITLNVVGLIFNTYCLQYVDASFYQVRDLVLYRCQPACEAHLVLLSGG
jgi:GDP-fucose transporter C1